MKLYINAITHKDGNKLGKRKVNINISKYLKREY